MNVAILGFSIIGAASGVASLIIMAKTAKKLDQTKTQVEEQITEVKTKVSRNAAVVKTAFENLEL